MLWPALRNPTKYAVIWNHDRCIVPHVSWLGEVPKHLRIRDKRGSSVHSSLAEHYTPFGSVKLLSPPSRDPAGDRAIEKGNEPVAGFSNSLATIVAVVNSSYRRLSLVVIL